MPGPSGPSFSSSGSSKTSSLPLQIALGHLLIRAFPISGSLSRAEETIYSSTFTASILSLVGREAWELCPRAATFDELKEETDELVRKESGRIGKANERAMARGQVVGEEKIQAGRYESWLGHLKTSFEDISEGAAFIDKKELRDRLSYDGGESLLEAQEVFERRSPIGLWVRGLILTLRKLSFEETTSVAMSMAGWCGVPSGSRVPWMGGGLNRRLAMDETLSQRSTAMREYQASMRSGDWSGAMKGLRRLYDYQFPGAGRGQHQHALLNLASFHHSTGGRDAARLAIKEAIRVARAEGDKACLGICMSLLHRLDMETSPPDSSITRLHPSSIVEELPKAHNAIDELWALRVALDLGEPLPRSFERIYTTLARLLPPIPERDNPAWSAETPFPIGAWHAAQAALWSATGSRRLAELHEDLALASEEANGDVRLTILLSRAMRAANAAEYDHALGMLLEYPSEGMGMAEYQRWAEMVWCVLERRARFSGDRASEDLIDGMRPRKTPSSSEGTHSVNVRDELRAKLRKAMKMKSNAPTHLILPEILFCIQTSQKLGLWPMHRLAVVIFAETLLAGEAEGMGRKAKEEVEEIWEQIVGGDDLETTCRGAMVLGRAYIDIGLGEPEKEAGEEDDHKKPSSFDHAKMYLQQAHSLAVQLEARDLIIQSSQLLALLSELGRDREPIEREESKSDQDYAAIWEKARSANDNETSRREEIRRVGEVIKLVGVRVAEGW